MQPLTRASAREFSRVRFVLTDMDETLTFKGRLGAATYDALERLQRAGVRVIPVTAAPAGWCDQMARMWPVDGVIGENGGLHFHRDATGHGLTRSFWHDEEPRSSVTRDLARIGEHVRARLPGAIFADDQPFRLTSLAFTQPAEDEARAALVECLREAGATTTVNNLWVLGWIGAYDKLAMARRVLAQAHGLDIAADNEAVLYVGDSTNDAPMFGFFRQSVGVSTVTRYLHEIPTPPAWITEGPGGSGFVEAADAVIRARGG
ncbi:HAD-IIB family hydrolase [Ancylobacter sp. WKF20]|uniref:HAD-IIB family hydrolase n=1 Tax=Ancylobacter sp. WKF20 TaxID=3039801 RepID=UPI0024342CC3|nr:HAD-IIB family hydrolase [Ancylobacter sp. WKF20]WGD30543.1 HAD-IIB family hydrolase [Ancylobacter sp. WKF20]